MASNSRVVIVPAAGLSQRYRDAGIFSPKPLIPFKWRNSDEQPMIQHALGALALWDRVVVVCPKGSEEMFGRAVPVHWDILPIGMSRGQADSVLQGLSYAISNWGSDQEVMVVNTDAGFVYPLNVFYEQAQAFRGAAMVFRGHGDTAFSYINDFPLFSKAEEKRPVSSWAMAGAYYFKHADLLHQALLQQMRNNVVHAGEVYLSGVYNTPPLHFKQFLAVAMHRWQLAVWGTPEDLARDRTVSIVNDELRELLSSCE